MGFFYQVFLIFLAVAPSALCQVTEFVSIDCGGSSNYTDPTTGLAWIPDTGLMSYGQSSKVQNPNVSSVQYSTRRDFPIDGQKYCYTLRTEERRRYIVRTTFLYGNPDTGATFPQFELYLDTTKWTTVTIFDAARVYVKEMIIRAPSESVDVCLCCATTGAPFISTLELRPLNLSMYATNFEDKFFLEVAARVNFGALTPEALRYPDDPYDRIWDSDLEKRQNFLVGVASGTERINTSQNVDVSTREYPPVKVMQTAVVGTKGLLTYRLNLEDFPSNARAYAYFAEIEDLGPNETRKFTLTEPDFGDYNNAVVNIVENANGSYRLYEPSYMNVSLAFILSFAFQKTSDSTQGPLLNAIEISRYAQIASRTDVLDVTVVDALHSMSSENVFTDQGDPCLPVAWEWVTCNSMTPPRITKIRLSGRGIKGMIPSELNNLVQLMELWLDGNSFSGKLPDMSGLTSLQIVHLENNQLTGPLPPYLGTLPNLIELNIENNSFTGEIPPQLLSAKIKFKYGNNIGLHGHSRKKMQFRWILGASIGVFAVLILLLLGSLLLLHNLRRRKSHQKSNDKGGSLRTSTKTSTAYSIVRDGHLREEGSHYIALSDLESATDRFSKKIGKGSFGSVY